jgi:cobalt-zinc-cadmium resistance protein CzcA
MTAIVAIFGLLPASLATGLGSDVQRPLATVIVWGLFSSMLLTLFVVPVGYRLIMPRTLKPPSGTEPTLPSPAEHSADPTAVGARASV